MSISISQNDIDLFCASVHGQDYEKAAGILINLLHTMEVGSVALVSSASDEQIGQVQTQIASAITTLFCDLKFSLNAQGFSAFMSLKTHLRLIFASSGFRDMAHISRSLLVPGTDGSMTIPNGSTLFKYLISSTLDTATDGIINTVRQLQGSPKFLFWLSCLDNKYVLSKRESELRHEMVNLADSMTEFSANSIGELQAVTRAWMLCSYWDYEEKHSVKKSLNKVLLNTLKQQGVIDQALAPRQVREVPCILVVLETWKSNSAMYRSYSKAIEALKTRYQVIGIADEATVDDKSRLIFDKLLTFGVDMPIKQVVDQIKDVGPDIMYYPSVGMHQAAIQLAQLRLAPIQFMTGGHPASSFSKNMDYLVIDEGTLGDPERNSEIVTLVENGTFVYYKHPGFDNVEPTEKDSSVFRIAVNSMYFKINPGFLESCREIRAASDKPIEFQFLIGLNAANKIPITRFIRSYIEDAACYGFMAYDEYLQTLANCDLQLAPFPFGNANSFVDAMELGIPTLCMDGPEIHSHNDATWAARVGLPDHCIAADRKDYISKALNLIQNDSLRADIARGITARDSDEIVFGDPDGEQEGLCNLVDWILVNDEAIRKSSKKVWHVSERSEIL